MKKIVLILVLLMCGCSNKYIVCSIKTKNTQQNYRMDSTYTIYYHNGYVKKVSEKETYLSNDETVLDYYENYLKMQLLNFQKLYGGITYEISTNKNIVTYQGNINFDKVDTKALKHYNYVNGSYIKGNRVTLTGIVNRYEQKGAICK